MGVERKNVSDPYFWLKQCCGLPEESWAKIWEKALNSDSFSENIGKQWEVYLQFMEPAQKNNKIICETLGLPTQENIAKLASQIINLETKVDNLDEKLEDLSITNELPILIKSIKALSDKIKLLNSIIDKKIEENL